MDSGLKPTLNRNTKWCKGRTATEKRMILLITILIIISISLIIALAIIVQKQKHYEDGDVCTTPGCIHAASMVLDYMDPTVDPCDDFYEFSCGKYLKETSIPEDKVSVSSFSSINEVVRDQLKLIIEDPIKPDAIKPYHLIKKYYNLCMNTTAIEAEGLKTIKEILKDLGGWPILEGQNWKENEFDWKQSVYKFRKFGFSDSHFILFYVGGDDKNSTRRIITLDQPGLSLSREFLIKGFEEKLVKAYYDYMVDVAVIFGANRNISIKELKDSLEFEIELAKISMPKEERRNDTALYNPMSVEELQHTYGSINWLEYLTNILQIPSIKITYDEMVVVRNPKFIASLEDLLNRTPKRVQANYVMRRAALSYIYYLTDELRNRQLEYTKIFSGQTERKPRWKECTSLAVNSVYLASGSLYVKKFFNEDAKHHAEQMVADIRKQFRKILQEVDWMDDETKQHALEKADDMTAHIGYSSELLDDEKIEKYYENLELVPDSYLKSMISSTLFNINRGYKKLREPVNKTDWTTHSFPMVVNAFYSSSENSIQFPAGILQGIFFGADRPRYMNYGGIGYVIGHEITHGFDDQGRQYDKDGNLNNWWDEGTEGAFIEKARCIIEQYGNYTVPEVDANLNGINTQGENIADNGGIKEAYLAYQDWVSRNGPEQKLPALNYTPNQIFWIVAAQSWCSKTRKEALKIDVTTGVHSPDRYRILGPFGNTEFFSQDYNCPLGSKMNPENKCHVW